MPLRIIRNDITKVAADAIVNTANPYPCVGAGTDQAIHEAAGPALLDARKAIGEIAPGQSVATPAFNLPANYVFHTVCPVWQGGKHGEEALLHKAYDSALELAEELGCASLAFPLMAAGSYGFPQDLALSVAVGAITDFLMEHDLTVYLVLFGSKVFGLASSLFDDLKSYIDDHYVAEKKKREYGPAPYFRRRFEANFRKASCEIEEEQKESDSSMFSAAMDMSAVCDHAPSAARMEGDLGKLLSQCESSFSEFLLDLLKERSGKDSEVYKRAEISKQLFSKILSNKRYQPTKDTAIQLAIGLQLDLNQTQKLLEKAGYALTRSSKADLVVQYYIEKKIYSVTFINEALADCGLPLLKTGLKA